ncbi:DUF202 domain-containing protein [Croceicoccus naphthovorans]|uniref:DUF202 domain-containing protein n=1 Tax=Croceicoccus naphthovorans TaxID=1348774 RepID=UPI0012E0BB18|nr:DUF202 domain-containing protein [Croceicoccus naphthovorans]MBB3991179.1 uncharacterized membrane protein YidH (DUF202 family) [Croceicoccus naphthovorans]
MADDNLPDDHAERKTDLAEDRTLLANERTFAGWVRTGLASVGIGLGFHALFEKNGALLAAPRYFHMLHPSRYNHILPCGTQFSSIAGKA